MECLRHHMIMYVPVLDHEADRHIARNMALLALQHWQHMWQRDLISEAILADAYRWKFKHPPQSSDARVITFNHLNGHIGLFW